MEVAEAAVARFGWLCWDAVWRFGRFSAFALGVLERLFGSPLQCLRWRLLGPQLFAVGTASIPVIGLIGLFIGMILALETFDQFEAVGQQDRLGGVITISVVQHLGPMLSAVMLAGRVGGALAAELGTMRVTEQLDAMRAMGADPIRTLVAPRVIACLVMGPLLTIYSDVLGTFGAWIVTVKIRGVADADYWHYTAQFVHAWDPISGLVKAACFGAAIGVISCYKGFHCNAGAAGVGRAATNAFVSSFLAIIILNLVLARFLDSIFLLIWGKAPGVFS